MKKGNNKEENSENRQIIEKSIKPKTKFWEDLVNFLNLHLSDFNLQSDF